MDIKRLLRKEMPAPLWKRVIAYLIDSVVLAFILLPLEPFDISYSSFSDFSSHFTSALFTAQFIFTVLFILVLSLTYWTFLEYRFHQTLGKYLLHIIVRSEDKQLTFRQCFLRNISKIFRPLLFADTLYMFFSHRTQRYSEMLARTEVVSYG